MDATDLALFTTREIIDELMRRKTFLGVVVQSESEFRENEWKGEKTFQVHFNSNLEAPQASRLLELVSDYMDTNPC